MRSGSSIADQHILWLCSGRCSARRADEKWEMSNKWLLVKQSRWSTILTAETIYPRYLSTLASSHWSPIKRKFSFIVVVVFSTCLLFLVFIMSSSSSSVPVVGAVRPGLKPTLIEQVLSGLLQPGVGRGTFTALNIILLALIAAICFMFTAGFDSIHSYILLFLTAGLLISVNWSASRHPSPLHATETLI